MVTFKNSPVDIAGTFVITGQAAPDFRLVATDLTEKTLADYAGKTIVLNIFPSLDTQVCAMSVRKFNTYAAKLPNTVVLAISNDLPFAHARFCTVEGIDNVVALSAFRSNFGTDYGVLLESSPLKGLLTRAVVVIKGNKVVYSEQVAEITTEPNYEAAINAVETAS